MEPLHQLDVAGHEFVEKLSVHIPLQSVVRRSFPMFASHSMRLALGLIIAAAMAGCATPVKHVDGPMQTFDKNTRFAIVERPDGFSVEVDYSRYQFVPESDAVAAACRQQVMAVAYDVADKRGKKLVPINEQRIQLSMGRNGFSGITSCRAMAVAEYAP